MQLFGIPKAVIGMIHLLPLPGTPKYRGSVQEVLDAALTDAAAYSNAGIDVLMVENMHDVPYINRNVGPEVTAVVTKVLSVIKQQFQLPLGVQILAGANNQALAAALASGADFIRAEGFVFAHVADEGMFNSDAGELLRYRKNIGAERVLVFTDIKKKHSSHSITADTGIAETAKAAGFFLSDGVIITGFATGDEPSVEEIAQVKKAVDIPVLSGSGVTLSNVEKYLPVVDAMIVGSWFKKEGKWQNPVSEQRVEEFMRKVNKLR